MNGLSAAAAPSRTPVEGFTPYRKEQFNTIWHLFQDREVVTVKMAADALTLKKSKYVQDILDEMWRRGWLSREYVYGRWARYEYKIAVISE